MIPKTQGKKYDMTKIAQIECIQNDSLAELDIKDKCFLLLIVREGMARFEIGGRCFEAIAPCLVCFDEREQPRLIEDRTLFCDAIYFHPMFLNVNMTFEQVHSRKYEELALSHDMFLMRPFIDQKDYDFPIPEEMTGSIVSLFAKLKEELEVQRDWYWSCRSRSYFLEMILLLERIYGIIGRDEPAGPTDNLNSSHLKNAIIYIESHYGENLTLGNIARAASMNHSTLTSLFKSELHMTAIEYLWHYRLTVAKKHLEFTNLPLGDISARCGFKTVQHFSRKFKAAIGQAPGEFRESAIARRKAAF